MWNLDLTNILSETKHCIQVRRFTTVITASTLETYFECSVYNLTRRFCFIWREELHAIFNHSFNGMITLRRTHLLIILASLRLLLILRLRHLLHQALHCCIVRPDPAKQKPSTGNVRNWCRGWSSLAMFRFRHDFPMQPCEWGMGLYNYQSQMLSICALPIRKCGDHHCNRCYALHDTTAVFLAPAAAQKTEIGYLFFVFSRRSVRLPNPGRAIGNC